MSEPAIISDSDVALKDETWHTVPQDEVLRQLEASEQGLSSEEVEARLERYGPNKLEEEEGPSAIMRFLRQFHDTLIYVLIVAAAVTAIMGEWVDTGVILAVVVINAIIGYIQEARAEEALASLRQMLSPVARVLRDGRRREINAEGVVPGDIVLIESGDRVPADLRIISARNVEVEEAALTGESKPVTKDPGVIEADASLGDRTNMLYSSTTLVRGQARGVVVATGDETEIGRIGQMLAQVEELTTPLLRQTHQFGQWLAVAIVGVAAATFAFGYAFRPYTVEELFLIAVAIAVAAIPEGLPAIMTITLALGVQRMARRNAIIRLLPAVETLGSVSVICSDKTGTLTRNEMTVKRVIIGEEVYAVSGTGYEPNGHFERDGESITLDKAPYLVETARAGLLASDAQLHQNDEKGWTIDGDPTEGGVVVLAAKAGLDRHEEEERYPRIDVIPFESDQRYMATLHHTPDDENVLFIKGAPERILALCDRQRTPEGETSIDADRLHALSEELADEGHRMLAVARGTHPGDSLHEDGVEEGGFLLLGIYGLIDPPREEAIEAVSVCKDAGIRVKMITGDHALTARSIGASMGIGDGENVVTGKQLEEMSDEELIDIVPENDVYARTSPEHKLRLVKALQHHDRIVAMTGDGVNDAPALKRADVGVAMGIKGAETSKDASDMVLADDNFASIERAIEEGRTIYDNLKKAILFLLPTNGAQSLMLLVAVAFAFEQLPVTAVQVLWVNMVAAVTLALALAFEPAEPGIMRRPPRDPNEPLLSKLLIWRIGFVSIIIASASFGMFFWQIDTGASLGVAQATAVNTLMVGQAFYLFNVRFLKQSAFNRQALLGNPYAFLAVGIMLLLQLGFTYLPFMQTWFGTEGIALAEWGVIVLVGPIVFVLVEVEKAVVRAVRR